MKGGGGRGGWERPRGTTRTAARQRDAPPAGRPLLCGRLPAQDAARNEGDGRGRPTGEAGKAAKKTQIHKSEFTKVNSHPTRSNTVTYTNK